MKRSLYQMLGISPEATPEEIKTAYTRRLEGLITATQRGETDAINEERILKDVREILLDPASRAAYDQRLKDPDSTTRSQVLFMPKDEATRKKLGVETIVLIVVVAVLSGVVYKHFARKMQEMDEAHKQAMAQQRLDRVPKAQVVAPVEEEKSEPLVPLPVTAVPTTSAAAKGEQK
jgi:curved DNA-binding protein CbpA